MNLPEIICNRRKFADDRLINLKAEQVCPGRSLEKRLKAIELDRIRVKVKLDRETDELRLALLNLSRTKKRPRTTETENEHFSEDERPHSVSQSTLDYEQGIPPPEGSVVSQSIVGNLSARYHRPSYRELRQREASARARVNLLSYQRLITDLRQKEEQRKIRQAEFLKSMNTIESSVRIKTKERERAQSFSLPIKNATDISCPKEMLGAPSIQNYLLKTRHAAESAHSLEEPPPVTSFTSISSLSDGYNRTQSEKRTRRLSVDEIDLPKGRISQRNRRKSLPHSSPCNSDDEVCEVPKTESDTRPIKARQSKRTFVHVFVPQGNTDTDTDNSPTKLSLEKNNAKHSPLEKKDGVDYESDICINDPDEAKVKPEVKPTKRVSFRLDKVQRWVDEMPEEAAGLEARAVSSASFQSGSARQRNPTPPSGTHSTRPTPHRRDSSVGSLVDGNATKERQPLFLDCDDMTDTDYVWDEVRKCRYIRGYDPPEMQIPSDADLEKFVFAPNEDNEDFDSTATEDNNSIGNVGDLEK
ncbi:uncharacterized protein LOC106165206 [Lingula anatina]|uniref:Uncharacterized protein LOC106165206 n=1 Tax=Lingula anatina TaxID=7574 RepID=A0A1S3IKK2_LINAN|nr:uncharacterized protein LOC106165206 [Lingula anatina]|eukprot:XP_013398770.1 uncharacterized protein LOC106165206 [Lingula anatina]